MSIDKLEIIASKVVLGLILPEDLPINAVNALEDGFDSPSLRILAGLTTTEVDDAWPMFDRALAELNVPRPSKRDAVMRLARENAKEILSGSTSSYVGAKRIWELSLRIPDVHLPELDTFVYGASEWEDRPEDRHIFEEGIVAAAKDLLRLKPGAR